MATNRASWHCDSTSKPKQRQQIVLLSTFKALGHHFKTKSGTNRTSFALWHHLEANKGKKSCLLPLRHHFEAKILAKTNVLLGTGGITSNPKQRQEFVLLATGAALRSQGNGNKNRLCWKQAIANQRQESICLSIGGNKIYTLVVKHSLLTPSNSHKMVLQNTVA